MRHSIAASWSGAARPERPPDCTKRVRSPDRPSRRPDTRSRLRDGRPPARIRLPRLNGAAGSVGSIFITGDRAAPPWPHRSAPPQPALARRRHPRRRRGLSTSRTNWPVRSTRPVHLFDQDPVGGSGNRRRLDRPASGSHLRISLRLLVMTESVVPARSKRSELTRCCKIAKPVAAARASNQAEYRQPVDDLLRELAQRGELARRNRSSPLDRPGFPGRAIRGTASR